MIIQFHDTFDRFVSLCADFVDTLLICISWKWRLHMKKWYRWFVQESDWDNGAYVVKTIPSVYSTHSSKVWRWYYDVETWRFHIICMKPTEREISWEKCTFAYFSIIIRFHPSTSHTNTFFFLFFFSTAMLKSELYVYV